ncbi:MAG TPA: NAD(P)-binding domain-containing protein [Mobilitalea sp.]|nr:NAD(P)-binding domain-containing protein [Mobilitalea sp.]
MDHIGFIGYGSMGSMLVKGLIRSGKINQHQIFITRKDKNKLSEIKDDWPEINLAEEASEVAEHSKYIFLCVKPADYYRVLTEIKPVITSEKHIISITSAVMLEDMERVVSCKITKILPTVISEIGEGITLICHNSHLSQIEAQIVENMLESFTKLCHINEEDFGLASQFTSSGPGFYAALLQEFVEAGLRYSDSMTKEEMVGLVSQTVYGTAKLMLENCMNFTDVVNRVATKGGITEEGVIVMKEGLPAVFDQLFEQTMGKRKVVDEKIHQQFIL